MKRLGSNIPWQLRRTDLFMSPIQTCELNKVNPFDYLTTLLRHPAEPVASRGVFCDTTVFHG
jgi:hypothetical protein